MEDNPNLTGLSLYYTNDLNPDISRTGITRGFVNEDRYRIALQHRVPLELEKDAEWRVDANLNILSDNYYLEDFNPDLFRNDPNPDNTIGLFRRDDGTLFSLFTRLRPNEFYRSDTRLPEIAMDFARRPLFDSPILHEGTASFSVVEEEIGSASMSAIRPLLTLPAGDPMVPVLLAQLPAYERELIQTIRSLPPGSPAIPGLATQLFSPGYSRFHTYQELSMPMNVGGWLALTPEVGLGYSRYSNVNGPSKSVDRTHMHAGLEASMKFSKNLGDVQDRNLGLDGLLHVGAPHVVGVETSEEAVASAWLTASELAHPDARFVAADATAWALATDPADRPDVVVVNPPRRGIGPDLARWLQDSAVPCVVYSSCNAVSLAADLAAMPSLVVREARVFDMFPQTTHYEVAVLLERGPRPVDPSTG
ncbi:MAG: LPS-assembly protein LptD [Proteobacteria bacterium]|nr:MAG: LPS-assembly protein LptD [Pseudomonadota bacterium]